MTYFLYGPPGSGKTTTGRILARRLDLPFWDLDSEIEARTGMALSQIFDRGGEPELRARERQTLMALLTHGRGVIALGGGALLDPDSFRLVTGAGPVLCLTAPEEALKGRLESQTTDRPLLRGSTRKRLQELLTGRQAHYGSFALRLNTEGLNPEESAEEAQLRLGAFHVCGLGKGCDVRVQSRGMEHLGEIIHETGSYGKVVVVADRNVGALYADSCIGSLRSHGFAVGQVTLPNGEGSKELSQVSKLWRAFQRFGLDRESTVVSLGGGVVSDTAGFAAATFLRGIPWVNVPTTLLSMVDAGLGGKTAVNFQRGKNLVGAFHSPRLVMVDPETLRTLPEAEWRSGVAEVVKHGVIGDPALLELASMGPETFKARVAEIIPRAIAVKLRIVEADPYERGVRAILNYGHTVGHGLETASRFRLRHGEAVSIGMVVEACLSEWIGLATVELAGPLSGILARFDLPTAMPRSVGREALVRAMMLDKKRKDGRVRFALPLAFGKVLESVEVKGWDDWIMSL